MTTPTPSLNYRTGKICYIEIPAIDVAESAQFYQQVFGWHTRQRVFRLDRFRRHGRRSERHMGARTSSLD
jgi:predicted enzyme related to lactoylglutathione lyase